MKIIKNTVVGLICALAFCCLSIGLGLISGGSQPHDVNAAGGPLIDYGTVEGGTGAVDNPYLIGTYNTLNTVLRNNAGLGKHFALISNIDMTGNTWTPIPLMHANSVFDGNGFTLNGLKVSTTGNVGMFVNFRGTIKNLTFTNATITSGTNAGIISGVVQGDSTAFNANIENVRIDSGSISGVATRTGGFIGEVLGSGQSTTSRFNVNIKNSYNIMPISGGNCTGGFIGIVSCTSGDINISNSFHEGDITGSSNIVGGIIAGFSGATNHITTIENCYAKGKFKANGTYSGGIVGYLSGSAVINIKNSFAMASLVSGASQGGIFGGGAGATVTVDNCYFSTSFVCYAQNGTTVSPTPPVSGHASATVTRSSGKTTDEMNTQAFVDLLNQGSGRTDFILKDGLVQLKGHTVVILTFNPNGGKFVADGDSQPVNITIEDEFTLQNEEAALRVERIGYEFDGWYPLANGTGEALDFQNANSPQADRTYYAKWNAISYSVADSGAEDWTSGQFHFKDADNQTITAITINQEGYIETIADLPTDNFVNWMVKSGSSWVSLGAGDWNENTKNRARLNFVNEDGEFLINEEFVNTYGYYENDTFKITFKAIFSPTAPSSVTVDVDDIRHRSWGTLKIDGATVPFNSTVNYVGPNNITIKAIPNLHRSFVQFEDEDFPGDPLKIAGVPVVPVEDTTDGGWVITIPVVNGQKIIVVFAASSYGISVVGETVNGAPVVFDTAITGAVGLNSSFIVNLPAVPGHRLTQNSVNNIRIYNQLTDKYDYISAINGQVKFVNLTADFFNKYLGSEVAGEIVITAEYVRQFALNIVEDYPEDTKGSIKLTVTASNGFKTRYYSFAALPPIDEGCDVLVEIFPDVYSKIASVLKDGIPVALNGKSYRFTLDKNTTITVELAVNDRVLTVKAIDIDDALLDFVEIKVNGSVQDAEDKFLFMDFAAINSIVKEDLDTHMFVGWFVLKSGQYVEVLMDEYGNIEGDAQLINQPGYESYLDGIELNLFAVYAKVFAMSVKESSGTKNVTYEVISGSDMGGGKYSGNTVLKITVTPEDYYFLSGIDGLYDNESIVDGSVFITIDGLRNFSINCVPEKFAITQNDKVKKASGSVEINATELGVGDKVVITFKMASGQERTSWKINGVSVANLVDARCAVVSGNTVTLTITSDWLQEHGSQLDSTITTMINRMYLILIVGSVVVIAALVAGTAIVLVKSRKRKELFAKAMQKHKEAMAAMSHGDLIQKLRQGE